MRNLAQEEGRQLQTLVEKALVGLSEKRKQGKPRLQAMEVYQAGYNKSAPLYKKLA